LVLPSRTGARRLVACGRVEEKIGLVFSWDPRTRTWVKERGPEDAAPPPAEPIDNGAVQTYFLDPSNGRWQGTILGLKGRQIAVELKTLYRAPAVSGLAIAEPRKTGFIVEAHDQEKSSGTPVVIVGLIIVLLIGLGGAVASQTILAPAATASDAPAGAGPAASSAGSATATPGATVAASGTAAATIAPTEAPTNATPAPAATGGGGAPVRTPVRTVAPTLAPISITTMSTTLANGTTITFKGPNGVLQNTAFDAQFTATQANGQPAFDTLTMYLGQLGTGQSATITPTPNAVYFASVKVTLAKGDQLLSVKFGRNGETRILGTITVR
jgi:hypothetical protein